MTSSLVSFLLGELPALGGEVKRKCPEIKTVPPRWMRDDGAPRLTHSLATAHR